MILKTELFSLHDNMRYDELSEAVLQEFLVQSDADGSSVTLISFRPIRFHAVRFRFTLLFISGLLKQVSLTPVQIQDDEYYKKFKDPRALNEKWLGKTYGRPGGRKPGGIVYYYKTTRVSSEYDPRSGSAEIVYQFK